MRHRPVTAMALVLVALAAGEVRAQFADPVAGEDGQAQAYDRDVPEREARQRWLEAPPRIGDPAPDFTLRTPDGQEIRLSDLYAEKPVVLEFGSLTCPVYRGKIEQMQVLRQRFGDAVNWLVVYTVEPHPAGSPSPYSGREWIGERNQREGLLIAQPADYEARVALAQRVIAEWGEQRPMVVDGMDNAVWEAYGRRPNSGFIIGTDGTVIDKQFWMDAQRMSTMLAQLVAGDPQRPATVPEPTVTFEGSHWAVRDLQYGEADGHALLLDAYLPADDLVHPALIFIHGGGWRGGSKAGGFQAVNGDAMIAAGIAVFSIDYRLSGVAPYPAAVDDCLAAIRWLRAHSGELSIDPDRLAVWGSSAGGHLALMVGFIAPGPEDVDAQGNRLPSLVRCVVDKFGPTYLAADDISSQPAVRAFLGGSPEELPEVCAAASPLTHASPQSPPVLIMHGTDDRTVPYSQSVLLKNKLDELGVPCELITFEGAGHGLRGADPAEIAQATQRALEFVREHLLDE